MADFDSPWKEAMDRYFALFLQFFFPKIHALLDWTRDYEPLDSELRKLAQESETGKRFIDKLIKTRKVGTGDMRLVHVEVQCRKEEGFAHRLHVYNYRAEDVQAHPVLTMVVLGDEDPDWRPVEYVFEEEGCRRTLSWPIVKLLDYAKHLDELERGPHLFGRLVVAHLVAQRTEDPATRKTWKLRLLRGLYSRNLDGEDIRQWSRFIDWLLVLPRVDEVDVDREIRELEKETKMPFVTSFERLANERAELKVQEGLREAELKLRQGELKLQETLRQGELKLQETLRQGELKLQQGELKLQETLQQSELAGLYRSIEALLDVRFRAEGLALMPDVRQKTEVAFLERLVEALRTDATLEDIRNRLAS